MAEPQYTPPTRVCSKCHTEKPVTDFAKNPKVRSGLRSECRACQQAQRYRDPLVVERKRTRDRAYPKRPKAHSASQDGERERARAKLRTAVDAGKVARPDRCADCGTVAPVHGHHADYARPLDVEWLCVDCHAARHRKQITGTPPATYPNKKLTADEARAILARAGTTDTATLAREYGVTRRTIQRVINRTLWAHLERAD